MATQNPSDPYWYKDAIIYELHVRAFHDSNGDGIGDFQGLIQKLDYLSDIGVTAIWLLPFYPSPLKDDGYDISNYTEINPAYGTLRDFRQFLQEAHRRGLRVITELVINHTSDQHDWFQRSRRARPGTYWRDFYVWSDDPNKYKGTRIIFKDFETSNWTYDPVAKSYYWHRFYSHQPDLNFDNPEVQNAIFNALDFWMEMGVDGMRLDAVPYLYERENTSSENLPETHDFLKKLRRHVDGKYPNRMLLAEANQWPEDAVPYFGDGDECHMCFHFPLMPRLFMALKMEDRYSIIDILKQTPEIPENCQWATFLRNHDELTLEMVTDEERDYMHKVYATDPRARINLGIRRRLAPLVQNDRRQIELLNGLLFSLPGSPVIYYGDEIGMGDNIYLGDRDGVRTPFQWSPDRNAGFSKSNPQSLYLPVILAPEYHSEAINVETLQGNPNSLLWWMKKLIALRKAYPEMSRGKLEFIENDNPKVLSYLRRLDEQNIVCIANLSRTTQFVELDLSHFKGAVPVELFGQTDFPAIGDLPYFLTLSPYAFYWFEVVEKQSVETGQWLLRQAPAIEVSHEPLRTIARREVWPKFEAGFKAFLPRMRWFGGKGRKITSVKAQDLVFIRQFEREEESVVAILEIAYSEGMTEHYQIGVSYAEGDRAGRIREERPDLVIAESVDRDTQEVLGIFYDAVLDAGFSRALLDMLLKGRDVQGFNGDIDAEIRRDITEASDEETGDVIPDPALLGLEQSNTSVLFGRRFYLKLYRRLEEGENPEVEIGRYLTQKAFAASTPMLGALSYVQKDKKTYSLGILQAGVESEMDGWTLMIEQIAIFAEQALADTIPEECLKPPAGTLSDLRHAPAPEAFQNLAGYSFGLARQLGQKTAEMHLMLGDEDRDPAFMPEGFTPFHQRSVFQSFRNLTDRVMNLLRQSRGKFEGETQTLVDEVSRAESRIYEVFSFMKDERIDALRVRVHGDYHLGQVLFTGAEFYIVDFEGEPARGIGERRLKRSPLKDVAGMIRSFEYAAEFYLKERLLREEDRAHLEPCLKVWAKWAGLEFVNGYLETMGASEFIPRDLRQIDRLLKIFVLEKALYEVGYELRNRPDWVDIPLKGVLEIVRERKNG
jgi:maltose alpha-D-glucosyltransferase / alpha-amylase